MEAFAVIWIGLSVGLGLWSGLRRRARRRRGVEQLVTGFRWIHVMFSTSPSYRPLNDEETRTLDVVCADEQRVAHDAGFEVLGDHCQDFGSLYLVYRLLIDPTRTIVLSLRAPTHPQESSESRPVLESISPECSFETFHAEHPILELTPYGRHVTVPRKADLAQMLAAHRQAIQLASDLVRFRDLLHFQQEQSRLHELSRAWRAERDPAALLESDARALLGKHFDQLWPQLRERVTEVPKARAR